MKKIAFIIQDLFAQGAQYATALMVRGFVAKGYEVDLIVSKYHDFIASTKKNLKPFEVPSSVHWITLPHLKARQNVLAIRRYLRTSDAKAIICMSPNYTTAVRMAAIGLGRHHLLAHVEHGLAGMLDDYTVLSPPKKWTRAMIRDRWYWGKFDRVLTVSEYGRSDFARMHPWYPIDRIYTVYNPVVDDVFWAKLKGASSHPWLVNKDPSWFTFVTAAAHEEYKGHFNLLQAMKILKDDGERIRVVVFGKGALTDSYRKFIDDNGLDEYVSIAGFTGNFPAEAKSADAFVLPSNLESFGIVIVEALACGLPVVSTDAPFGPREVLDGGKYGTLVPVKDHEALAKAMCDVKRKGKSSPPDESWKRFTLEAAVKRYEMALGLK